VLKFKVAADNFHVPFLILTYNSAIIHKNAAKILHFLHTTSQTSYLPSSFSKVLLSSLTRYMKRMNRHCMQCLIP